ncbi:response regulator [Desulfatibacillum aliphaticivorans]|uniref:response regulator n=1 Tax=Desulfatibacillum aliphaticivorans TaxID=218208 RepID=UPI000401EFE2|nr:response regulator [Desulfatibacillum aliphaticivorans]
MYQKLGMYWSALESRFMPEHISRDDPLSFWRERILFVLFFVTTVLGPIALIPSVILSFQVDRPDIAIVDILAYFTAVFLLFSGKRLSLKARAWAAFGMLYSLGVFLLFTLGFHGAGYIWLFGASVLMGGIGGMRMAVWSLIINVLSMIGVGVFIAYKAPGWTSSLENPVNIWWVMTVNFMLISAMITITATIMLEGLKNAFDRERKAGRTLAVSQEKYKSLLETLPYGIQEIDLNGQVKFVNLAYQRVSGYLYEELVGTYAWDFAPDPEELEVQKRRFDKIRDNMPPPHPFTRPFLAKNGDILDLQVTWDYSYDQAGNLEGYLTVITDVTAQLKAENIRKDLEERLKHSQRMESIGTLAGGIAHDFNNILNSIIGFTELALDDAKPGAQQEECLQEVLRAGTRASGLVKQILTFARRGSEEPKPVRVSSITKETLQLLRSTVPPSIKIKQNIQSESLVMADPTQIHQVLLNLCTNAVQAMEEKGGLLQVDLADVLVDAELASRTPNLHPGEYLKMGIRDTGYGIPADAIQSIFEPYFTTKGFGKGTGLGLAVVHGIVQNCGGEILASSKVGGGSEFTIYLPLVKGKAEALPENRFGHAPKGREKVLFVDDEPSIVKLGGKMLERLGYTVTTHTSSLQALELVRNKPNGFDIVITDMTMPDMNGDVLAAELMKIRPDIPVILCTGYSNKITPEKAMDMGIKAFAMKPLVKSELAKSIRKVLDAQPNQPSA